MKNKTPPHAGTRSLKPRATTREPWTGFKVRHRSFDLKRAAVLSTAAQLFQEHGFQNTSLSVIAARLKITKPALYRYFTNKEEILAACYMQWISVLKVYLARADERSAEQTGLEQLRIYVHEYGIALLTNEFGRCIARMDEDDLAPARKQEIRKLKQKIDGDLRGLVEAGMEDGSIAPCRPKLVSFAIAGALNTAGLWYKPSGSLSPEDIACDFTHLLTGGLDRPAPSMENSPGRINF